MDWANERYVRVYTRDSVGWLALPWQARALLVMLIRKVDRAGVLDLGRHGEKGLAVAVGMPLDVVSVALLELVEEACVERYDTRLVIPNYIEAQEAAQTDAHRARESRANRRDRAMAPAVTKPDATVTNRDDTVTKPDANVTVGHSASHAVTSCHSVPSRTVPSRTVPGERRAPKTKLEGTPLPEDWTLTPGLLAWAKSKGVIASDALAASERFARHFHTSTLDSAVKRNWDKAYQAWLVRDITDGKVVASPPNVSTPFQPPTPEQLEQRAHSRAMIQAALAQLDANKGAA